MLACHWSWYSTPHLRHRLSRQRQSHLGSIKIQEAWGRQRGRPVSQAELSSKTPSLILRPALWHIQSWLARAQPSIWKLKRNLRAFITRCSNLIVIPRFNAISMSADGRRFQPDSLSQRWSIIVPVCSCSCVCITRPTKDIIQEQILIRICLMRTQVSHYSNSACTPWSSKTPSKVTQRW